MQYINNKNEFLSEIYERVKKIRAEIGLKATNFSIVDFEFKKRENDLIIKIYTPIRTDKSAIIGPGGWVIGKLREELNEKFEENVIIRVENYIDHKRKLEHFNSSIKFLYDKGIDLTDKYVKKEAVVLIQCEYDLSMLEIIKKYFNPLCLSFDLGTVILPHKNKNRIQKALAEKNIKHEILSPFLMNGKDIKLLSSKDPCKTVCNTLIPEIVHFARDNGIDTVIFNHFESKYSLINGIHVLNFLELFPVNLNTLNYLEKSLDCPLLIQSCRGNKNIKFEKIKNVVEKVYGGYIEPTEGSKEIMKFIN
ncbi:conserved hypothetical protein [Methanococcus vannielii SB]|uniref:Uncharacterized protein n=1 Tax=Methanococcus vannielii (strain ATCC 35089 / DSM 1224 / JCM 13029 / OCM 148 / SB) TaxID=406327 RepID=A6US63_METVS|nr:hypothetical protein [Methanococcus vannielii]ABR55335.1 conserved hypothetical protein [Methanococcus vannielii SB]